MLKYLLCACIIFGGAVSVSVVDQLEPQFLLDSNRVSLRARNKTGSILAEEPDRNVFWQWLQTVVGATTTEKPIELAQSTNCPSCKCGRTNKKNRIVGGEETETNQFPWMAMLLYSKRFYCGGSLLNDRYVITAAHCVSGFDKKRITVRLLEHDTKKLNQTEIIERGVERITRHNNYSPSNYNNDIALLLLSEPVKIEGLLRPVCMPTPGKSWNGDNGIVTGWGATSEQGAVSVNLQEVTVPIMSNAQCRKSGYGAARVTDNMMCAGYEKGERDSCQGDSGGPLHVIPDSDTQIHQIAGIVSWGEGCAKPNYPGVYTRVNRYGTWIRSNTKDACYCEE